MKNNNILEFRYLTLSDFDLLLELESVVFENLPDRSTLRLNSRSMWSSCFVEPNKILAAFQGGFLVAVSVLYFPACDEDDNLSKLLLTIPTDSRGLVSANHKICLVHPDYRGLGLQVSLARLLERYAVGVGVDILCATISPNNPHSRSNALAMGMIYDSTISKYGSERDLFYKFL